MNINQINGNGIYNTIGVPVLLIAPDFMIISANERALEAVGMSEAELIGEKCHSVFHKKQKPPKDCPLHKMLKTGNTESSEMVVETLDGTFIVTCAPVVDESGNLKHIVHTLVDITPQKQAEKTAHKALEVSTKKESEMLLLYNGARAVLKQDSFKETARHIFDSCCKLTGATSGYVALLSDDGQENEVLFLESGGRKCSVDPSLPMPVRGLRAEAYKLHKAVYDNDFKNSKWMKFMPDGHVDPDNVLFAPLNHNGTTVGIMGIANKPQDFTDDDAKLATAFANLAAIALINSRTTDQLIHKTEDLGISESKYQSLFENSAEGLLLMNEDMEFVEVNNAATRLFGYTREELIGMTPLAISAEKDKTADTLDRLAENGFIKRVHRRHRRKDGSTFISQIYSNRFQVKDKTFFLSMVRDVTEHVNAEAELTRVKERLELAMDAGNQGFWDWNLETDEVYYSPRYYTMLGYEDGELPNNLQTWIDLLHPEEREDILNRARVYAEKGKPNQLMFRLRCKDGSYRWISGQGKFYGRDKKGKPVRAVGIHIDIHEEHRAKIALQESNERFSTFFNASPIAIALTRLCDNILIDVNPAWEEITGFTHDEVVGRPATSLNSWGDLKKREEFVSLLEERGKVTGFETDIRHAGGSIKHVLLSAELIEFNGEKHMISMANDITEKMEAERSLRRSEEHLNEVNQIMSGVLQHTHMMAVYLDPQFNFVWVNQAYAETCGYEPSFFEGKNHFALYPHEENERIFQNVVDSGEAFFIQAKPFEFPDQPERGVTYWDWSLIPTKDEGNVTGLVFTLAEVTERIRAIEEKRKVEHQLVQSQKMDAIGNLAGGIAHDFNNLLTVIMGSANLLQIKKDNSDPEYIDLCAIMEAAESAKDLTMKLLTFSRRDKLNVQAFSADDIIDKLIGMINRTIPKSITINKKSSANPLVSVDSNQIQHALLNICNNAVDAMPDGGKLTIEISLLTGKNEFCHACGEQLDGSYCCISIQDTGTGIPSESLSRITEPFYTTKGIGKGTGLGLSVTQGIIVSHNGHMQVSSEVNQGTCVKIFIPVDTESVQILENKKDLVLTGTETVLVIDDEKTILSVAERLLTSLGYTAIVADSGSNGINLYRSRMKEIDIVVLDLMMPEMDGAATFKVLKEINPDIKVVLSSGFSVSGQARDLLNAGVKDFVQKPFNVENMFGTLRKVLDKD